jgi:hypothetical protein
MLFQDEQVLLDAQKIYPRNINGLGVREGNLYRLKSQLMHVVIP